MSIQDRMHQHKFFLAQVKTTFEKVNPGDNNLFRAVEWAYLVCACTEVIKRVVKNKEVG